jgi:alpha-D-ribose 1-methylphosphonate 5-triphosphate synthase subunit PhnH
MNNTALLGGFRNAAQDSAFAYRAALEAMSQPGQIRKVVGASAPAPLSAAAAVLVLTLCDQTTPLHLAGAHDCKDLRDWVTFHTGAPLVGAAEAAFALGTWAALLPVDRFAIGLADYPDRSATLIIEMPAITASGMVLRGPGIETSAQLSLPEIAAFTANRAHFPRGFDAFITAGDLIAGLPRSTIVEAL